MKINGNVITVGDRQIPFVLKRNPRSKSIRLIVHHDGRVVVSAATRVPLHLIEQFIRDKVTWLTDKVHQASLRPKTFVPKLTRAEVVRYKIMAKRLAEDRLAFFNTLYGFTYKHISIRNQKTRWGSCSKQGNINFNYRIALLPPELADYVIVHELCHLGAFNHSQQFWKLVARAIPYYKEARRHLRSKYHI